MSPPEPPDVLVIGAGVAGLVAAIRLREAGATVALVDAGQNAGSTANAGSLHVQMQSRFMRLYPDHVPNLEAALPFYRAAAEEWVRLEGEVGPFELVREGGLMLAEGEAQLAFLAAKAEREARKGLTVEILDRAALDRIAPWLGAQITGAEFCREEGKLNPLLANARLRARAASLGLAVIEDEVLSLAVEGDRVRATGRLGAYEGCEALVAAAWGAGDLVAPFGMAIPTRAEPLHMNITEPAAPILRHLVQHAERSITLKQFASGQIVIGGGWPARDRGRDRVPEVLAASLLGNVALAARLAPAIGRLRVMRCWAGMNTTIDGASVIGRLSGAPRIAVALPGDAGYTLGPLVGRMAAAILTGSTSPEDPAPYAPTRFSA